MAKPRAQEADEAAAEGDQQESGKRDAAGDDLALPAGHPCRERDHPFDALAHDREGDGIEPEGHQQHGGKAERHDDGADDRHGKDVAGKPVGRDAVEMADGINECRKTADQRGQKKAAEETAGRPAEKPEPPSPALPAHRPLAPGGIAGDEAERCGIGHLEARIGDGGRRDGEDEDCRERDIAQADGGPAEEHGHQHDADHDP